MNPVAKVVHSIVFQYILLACDDVQAITGLADGIAGNFNIFNLRQLNTIASVGRSQGGVTFNLISFDFDMFSAL